MSSGESRVIAGRRAIPSRTYKFSIAEAGFAVVLTHLSPAGSFGLSSVCIGDLSLSQAQYYNTLCFTHTAHAQMPPVKTARLAITIWMHEIEVDGLSYFSSSTHNCANVFRLSCSRTQGRNRHCHPSMCTNFPDSLTPRSMPSPLHSTLSLADASFIGSTLIVPLPAFRPGSPSKMKQPTTADHFVTSTHTGSLVPVTESCP